MNKIIKITHAVTATISTILLLLPYISSAAAGYFIYLSLCGSTIIALQALLLLATSKHRNYLWCIQGTLLVASIATYGKNHIPGGEQKTPHNEKLRIISWNAENFHINSDTLKKAAKAINNLDADIICLQERPHDNLLHRDSIRAAFPKHIYFCTNDREDEVLNVAILSKYPLTNIATHYFDPGYNKMIVADVETPQETITLWNVHLQTTSGNPMKFICNAQRRNKQAKELKKRTDKCKNPVIICGDFNDTPSSYAYRTIVRDKHDCYSVAGNDISGSYKPSGGIFRIDYILCSKQLHPISYHLLDNSWSDHKIQFAEIAYK